MRGEKLATATLYLTLENKTLDVDDYDEARSYADEKGVLFFSYRSARGFGVETRYFMRQDMLSSWQRVEFGEFRHALEKHRTRTPRSPW